MEMRESQGLYLYIDCEVLPIEHNFYQLRMTLMPHLQPTKAFYQKLNVQVFHITFLQ